MRSLSPDEEKYLRCLIKRRVCTIPLLVLAGIALLLTIINGFSYVRGQWLWHKTDATITMQVGSETSSGYFFEYVCAADQQTYTSSFRQPKVLFLIPYKGKSQVGDTESMAYKIEEPSETVVFKVLESQMLSWGIVFVVSLTLYFIVDEWLRRTSKVRII